jgi:diadenosine tetraphosphate (Ap4A) HIT family hydrolase
MESRIKRYDLWDLRLADKQYPYIGRAVALAIREDAATALDMTLDEVNEFFGKVLPDWNKAVTKAFNPDIINIACLCNDYKHLHWHLIPRYKDPVHFSGETFIDERFGHNYSPTPKKNISDQVTGNILEEMKNSFSNR